LCSLPPPPPPPPPPRLLLSWLLLSFRLLCIFSPAFSWNLHTGQVFRCIPPPLVSVSVPHSPLKGSRNDLYPHQPLLDAGWMEKMLAGKLKGFVVQGILLFADRAVFMRIDSLLRYSHWGKSFNHVLSSWWWTSIAVGTNKQIKSRSMNRRKRETRT